MRFIIAAAAAITALSGIASADVTTQLSVRLDRELLTTTAGTAKVYKTLERRVNNSCRSDGRLNVRKLAEQRQCRADLLDQLVSQVDHPRLTALHTGTEAVMVAHAQ